MSVTINLALGENLAETLDIGNFTNDGQVIKAKNGGSEINLRAINTNNVFYITNDNGAFLKAFLYADDTEIGIGFGSKFGFNVQDDTAGMTVFGATLPVAMITPKQSGIYENASPQRPVGSPFIVVDILAAGYVLYSPDGQALFLNSGNLANPTTFLIGVSNSVAAGGQGLTIKTNNSIYGNQLSLQEANNLFDNLITPPAGATQDNDHQLQNSSGTIAHLSDTVNGNYIEKWTLYNATLDATWETIVIADAQANSLIEITAEAMLVASDMGMRAVGSVLDRRVMTVAQSSITLIVKTDSLKQIQVYANLAVNVKFFFSAQL
jgi:hypothetical protein